MDPEDSIRFFDGPPPEPIDPRPAGIWGIVLPLSLVLGLGGLAYVAYRVLEFLYVA